MRATTPVRPKMSVWASLPLVLLLASVSAIAPAVEIAPAGALAEAAETATPLASNNTTIMGVLDAATTSELNLTAAAPPQATGQNSTYVPHAMANVTMPPLPEGRGDTPATGDWPATQVAVDTTGLAGNAEDFAGADKATLAGIGSTPALVESLSPAALVQSPFPTALLESPFPAALVQSPSPAQALVGDADAAVNTSTPEVTVSSAPPLPGDGSVSAMQLLATLDSAWMQRLIADPNVTLPNCVKGGSTIDPNKWGGQAPAGFLGKTKENGSRRNNAKVALCATTTNLTGVSPYTKDITMHHIIPQNRICASLQRWWAAAKTDTTAASQLAACFNTYRAVVVANPRYYPSTAALDNSDFMALRYLTMAYIWNHGNIMPGPPGKDRNKLSNYTMLDPNENTDVAILTRIEDGGAATAALRAGLSQAITSVDATSCTSFFQAWSAIANTVVEDLNIPQLTPLGVFWRTNGCNSPKGKPSASQQAEVSSALVRLPAVVSAFVARNSAPRTVSVNASEVQDEWSAHSSYFTGSLVFPPSSFIKPTSTDGIMPQPESDIVAATTLWQKQAANITGSLGLVAYEGPSKGLNTLTRRSSEVRRLLATARRQSKKMVAQAVEAFQPATIARRTIAAASVAIIQQSATVDGISPQSVVVPGVYQEELAAMASARITDVAANFAWDGKELFGFSVNVGGILDDEGSWGLVDDLYVSLSDSLPWMNWRGLPLAVPALMQLSASYEVASRSAVFTASTGNFMWLLSLIKDPVKATFGVDLPVENVGGPTATTAVSMSVGQTGLQQLSVGLGGSYTAASITRTLGLTWPVEDDMFVMRAPSVVYTVLPTNLAVTMEVDVPALGVQKMASSLVVQSAGVLQLQLFGQFTPFPGLTVTTMSLTAARGVGLQARATGSLTNIPVAISGQVATVNGTTAKTVSLTLTATNVGVGAMVQQVLTGVDVPGFLLNFINPIRFSLVSVTYNSAAVGRTKFGITAVPDFSTVPALTTIVQAVGLDASDIALRVGPTGGLQFGISKAYRVELSAPFTGPGLTTFTLAVDTATKGLILAGTFQAGLRINGARDILRLDIGAGIAMSSTNGVALSFSGQTLNAIVLNEFPWVQFGTFTLAASVSVKPPMVNSLTLAGSLTIAGVNGRAFFNFDKNSGAITMAGSLTNLGLQQILTAAGVNFNLGVLNVELRQVSVTYSTVDVPAINVQRGMQYRCSITVLGMSSDTAFMLAPDGVEFSIIFNAQEFSRVFNAEVLGRLDAAVNTAGATMRDAGSKLMRDKAAAEADLARARANVENARRDVEAKLTAFNDAKAKADTDLRNAQASVANAQSAFAAARDRANAALAQAERNFAAADRAFNEARDRAFNDLNNARDAVNRAQADFDWRVNDANRRINDAQGSVNWLWGEYNWHASRCNGWPWTWHHCAQAGGLWTAFQSANAALNVARAVLNDVVNGAVRWTLDSARNSLWAAQRTADGVLSGTQAVTRQTALGVLNAARQAADAVLRGSEAAAITAAQGALTVANQVAQGVLTGTHFVALQSANAGLTAANGILIAAERTASGTLDALNAALNEIGGALQSIKTANFLQLNSLGFAIRARVSGGAIGANYDFVVGGTRFVGSLSLQLSGNPRDMIIGLIQGECSRAIKATFKNLAPYLP